MMRSWTFRLMVWSAVLAAAGAVPCGPPAVAGERAATAAAWGREWYFAEGYTGQGFYEYLTFLNTDAQEAEVEVTYFSAGEQLPTVEHRVPGKSRYTVSVNEDAGAGLELSVRVVSDRPLLVERPMYFDYQGRYRGGHVGKGAADPSSQWYFAEGYTGPGFDEYLTLLNPNPFDCRVRIEYLLKGGGKLEREHTVPASRRYTVKVNDDAGKNLELSAAVTAYRDGTDPPEPAGIVAERPIYFLYGGTIDGGSVSLGSTALGTEWYFAEGYTGDFFFEYITVMNPNDVAVGVRMTYYTDDAPPAERPILHVPAFGRETVMVNTDVGWGRNVSVRLEAEKPVLAERPMYFHFLCGDLAVSGGDTALGKAPASDWLAAEGYTGPGFYEFVTLLNREDYAVEATFTYLLNGEPPQVKKHVVPPRSRYTVRVDGDIGTGKECGLEIWAARQDDPSSPSPLVVERPMYFLYRGGLGGGHIGMGFSPP
jgi:hypothetical protein